MTFKIIFNYVAASYYILDINVVNQRYEFDHFKFVILFIGILSMYVINLDVMCLFTDSSYIFLAILNDV